MILLDSGEIAFVDESDFYSLPPFEDTSDTEHAALGWTFLVILNQKPIV